MGTRTGGRTLAARFFDPPVVAGARQADPPADRRRSFPQACGGCLRPTDTTWHHFQQFRSTSTVHGLPLALYTDGLALFGHQSTTDGRDPRSEFQRALTALGVTHLVAPSPQAKGKIERRFGTFQKRLLALLAYEKITAYAPAQELLARELTRQNRTICRTTGLSPDEACAKAQAEKRIVLRACPDTSLLDLHLALYLGRRVNADHQVDFLGRSWPIGATARHTGDHRSSPPKPVLDRAAPARASSQPMARNT